MRYKLGGNSMYSQLSVTGKMCQSYKDVRLKAGFHERRSRSQSHNQKRKSLWSGENSVLTPLTTLSLTFRLSSSENQIVGVGSRSRRTKPITKHGNVHCDWFILPLLLLTVWFSLDHKQNISDGVLKWSRKKFKRFDYSDSDSIALMTLLTTPIFYFH